MNDITRYEVTTETRHFYEDEFEVAAMIKSANGDYVSYDDHISTISKLQSIISETEKALKEAQAIIKGIASEVSDNPVLVARGYIKGVGDQLHDFQPIMNKHIVPADTPHLIVFEDHDRENIIFMGHRARSTALSTFETISTSWNAHLFVREKCNFKNDQHPNISTCNLSEIQAQAIEYALDQWRLCSDSNLRGNLKYIADRIRSGDIAIDIARNFTELAPVNL